MEIVDLNNTSSLFTALILATISLAVGLQLLIKNWKSNSAESNLLKIMQTELERMNVQNTVLSTEVGKLQAELIRLSQQLTDLTLENQKLQLEISNLNKEIARLHIVMSQRVSTGGV